MTVLVADDDPLIRAVLRMALTDLGHSVVEARSVNEVEQLAAREAIALAIVDVHMPGGTIEQTLAALDARAAASPVLLLSGDDLPALARRDVAFARKPVDLADFTALVESFLPRQADHRAEHVD